MSIFSPSERTCKLPLISNFFSNFMFTSHRAFIVLVSIMVNVGHISFGSMVVNMAGSTCKTKLLSRFNFREFKLTISDSLICIIINGIVRRIWNTHPLSINIFISHQIMVNSCGTCHVIIGFSYTLLQIRLSYRSLLHESLDTLMHIFRDSRILSWLKCTSIR